MSTSLIIVSAGNGERLCANVPKAYVGLAGKPLLAHTIQRFIDSRAIDGEILIVINPDHREHFERIAENLDYRSLNHDSIQAVHGGASRAESVFSGLKALKPDTTSVFIHDAARPFVSNDIIYGITDALTSHQAVTPTLPITDAIKALDDGRIVANAERSDFLRMQTPQGFAFADILSAFEAETDLSAHPDDISLALSHGLSVGHIRGEDRNFKITFPEDLERAEAMLAPKTLTISAQGYDVHRTGPGDHVWLCGIKVPATFSLVGHSDADVGLHAVTDAILGTIGAGDIGDHFPPSDPKWKGAASDQFLAHAIELLNQAGGALKHVDVTIIAEAPKIKPHREAMRERLAEICSLPLGRVSLKATTTEKLGFTGRGEGLAAMAMATVELPE